MLILLAVQDRKYFINVGYGLEPILPDGKVGGFGREAVPYLKRGDYDGAVSLLDFAEWWTSSPRMQALRSRRRSRAASNR